MGIASSSSRAWREAPPHACGRDAQASLPPSPRTPHPAFAKKIARAEKNCGKHGENAVDQTDFRLDNIGLENRPAHPLKSPPMNPLSGLRTWSVECRI
jgi:hypothetical protein